ncbi:MAG: discoidin domain-containing protein [Phycisphaerae bacterium]|nr:discoidin domain-containing protein [Phycisphaerae bacterium]
MSKSRFITVVALGLMTLQTQAADKSLILYLPFDEGAGTTTNDMSTYSNPGTIVGNALWVAGVRGAALEFVSGSHVRVPEIPEHDVSAQVSLLAWVKATTVPNWARVIDKSQWQTTGFDLVLTQSVGLPRLEFFVNNTTSLVDGTTPVIDNEWHFLVGTFGNKTLRMYVDGQRQGQAQSTGLVDMNPNDWPILIGAESSSNGGQQYFGSIDEVAMYNRELSADEVMAIFQNGMALPDVATDPEPENGAVDVPCDAALGWVPGGFAALHDVYFATTFASVNDAGRDNPMDALVSRDHADTAYVPDGLLEYGQTYYWRIDEVNGAPDYTVFKGDVWSFTTEPYTYPITSLTVTASGQESSYPAIKTIDKSGLDGDRHSNVMKDMWIVKSVLAWIQYSFDKEYVLDELWVWNANADIESLLNYGAKDVTVEYSTDGETWTALENVPEFTQGPGVESYAADIIVRFGSVAAKHVKLTINGTWGSTKATSLSEVRFYYIPVQAFHPDPADGATAVSVEPTMNWRPGREATSHTVYIGADSNAVAEGLVSGETVTEHTYTPTLNYATTYYWKVDETGDAGTYAGEVWSFTTEEYGSVDDFESYNDFDNRIFDIWSDGYEDPANGSIVGYIEAPFAERTIVHSGGQSMPFAYNNTGDATVSEATLAFDPAQDWTQHGITNLVLYFRGQVGNSPAPLYVKINNTKVSYNDGAAATAMPLWKQWAIPLAETGAALQSVKSLTIGVQGSGAGRLFIDDIRLYAVAPEAVAPADPGTAGLVALYTMDGNVQDAAGKNYHGAISGDTSYEAGYAGQALVFNGINAYVDLPIGPAIAAMTDTTVATHVYFGGGSGSWQRIFDFGSGNTNYMFLCPRQGTSGPLRLAIRTPAVNEQIADSVVTLSEGWHHVAATIDSQAMMLRLYLDGELIASGATTLLPKDLGNTTQNWLGRSQYSADGYFLGSLDDFRIYNRALSAPEVRYLAGDR